MRYIPNSAEEREEMLRDMGRKSVADLFRGIPDKLKLKRPLDLPWLFPKPKLLISSATWPSATRRATRAKG